MKRLTSILILAASSAFATCTDAGNVHKATGNFVTDIQGTPDTRPYTWGTAGVVTKTVTFTPPSGCIVEITRVMGDFIAWVDFSPVPAGTQSGVLLSLTPTNVFICPYSDFTEDSSLLYIQGGTADQPVRVAINEDVIDGYLDSDNKLNINFASFLNNTGLIIHMEATLQFRYRFVTAPTPMQLQRDPAPLSRWTKSK